MSIKVLMPSLSPTMKHGNLIKWLKKEGEQVKKGEVIVEIETDKAIMEVESEYDGVFGKILVPEKTSDVKVNSLIAILLEEGETIESIKEHISKENTKEHIFSEKIVENIEKKEQKSFKVIDLEFNNSDKDNEKRKKITPLAKKIARLEEVDYYEITGTGPKGRITKDDIISEIALTKKININENNYNDKTTINREKKYNEKDYEDIPISLIRKATGKILLKSKQESPHFYITNDFVIDSIIDVRSKINSELQKDERVSINDFFVKACALALQKIPQINSYFNDDYIRMFKHSNIAVAVSIKEGIFTPVIFKAESKSISKISKEVKFLANKARDGKLTPDEYKNGTFTISNLGMFGVKSFGAILNPPQSAILAVGASEKRPIVIEDDNIVIRNVVTCTLSVDHRSVDGVDGALFMQELGKYLSNPYLLLYT